MVQSVDLGYRVEGRAQSVEGTAQTAVQSLSVVNDLGHSKLFVRVQSTLKGYVHIWTYCPRT